MREELIREFAERAESGVELPDLAALQERGRQRRRNRGVFVAAAGAVAIAVVGVAILASTDDSGRSAPPAGDPPGVTVQEPVPDKELAAGHEYTVAAFGQDYAQSIDEGEQIVVRFRVDGPDWLWFRDRVVKLAPGEDPEVWPIGPYAAVQFSLVDRFPLGGCPGTTPRWRDAGATPMAAARQAAGLAGMELVGAPTTTEWSGWPAAHVVLTPSSLCARFHDRILWSVFPQTTRGSPGLGTTVRLGQRIDLWFVAVEDTMLVIGVDESPALPRAMHQQVDAIRDSIEIAVEPVVE